MESLADFEYRAYLGRKSDSVGAPYFESLAETSITEARWFLVRSEEGRAYRAKRIGAWRALMPPHAQPSEFGITNTGHAAFEVIVAPGERLVAPHCMVSIQELTLLYELTRSVWRGLGSVVDLGPYYGLTSYVLAYGMMQNSVVQEEDKRQRLHVYDLFLSYAAPGTSIFPDFARINQRWSAYQAVHPGDLLALNWHGDPIEILMIDLAKSFELQDHVVQQFFPCLIPGATIIQQDYVYFDQYWIHVLMEIFADNFAFKEAIYSCSAVYELVAPLPDLSSWSLKGLYSTDQIVALHRAHVEKAAPNVQAILWCAHAKMLLDYGRPAEARDALGHVTIVSDPDPAQDFSGLATPNFATVSALVEAALPQ